MQFSDDGPLQEVLRKHGRFLTGFACLLILVVGITLVETPSRWWVSLLAVAVFATVIFTFLNARVFLKGLCTVFLTLFAGAWAFRIGAATGEGSAGSAWMTIILATFFLMLAWSYISPSPAGRWGPISLALVSGFMVTYLLLAVPLPAIAASLLGMVASVAIFFLMYFHGLRRSYRRKDMPSTHLSPERAEALQAAVAPHHWGVRHLKRRHREGVLVWNDRLAFVLTEVELQQKFTIMPRRRQRADLGYQGKSITPWLTSLTNDLIPLWGLKGAVPMLVLLDTSNRNGKEPRTIGVPVADSSRPLAVGIFPAATLLKRGDYLRLLEELQEAYQDFIPPLTPRQRHALDLHLPADEHHLPQEEEPREEAPREESLTPTQERSS